MPAGAVLVCSMLLEPRSRCRSPVTLISFDVGLADRVSRLAFQAGLRANVIDFVGMYDADLVGAVGDHVLRDAVLAGR